MYVTIYKNDNNKSKVFRVLVSRSLSRGPLVYLYEVWYPPEKDHGTLNVKISIYPSYRPIEGPSQTPLLFKVSGLVPLSGLLP